MHMVTKCSTAKVNKNKLQFLSTPAARDKDRQYQPNNMVLHICLAPVKIFIYLLFLFFDSSSSAEVLLLLSIQCFWLSTVWKKK